MGFPWGLVRAYTGSIFKLPSLAWTTAADALFSFFARLIMPGAAVACCVVPLFIATAYHDCCLMKIKTPYTCALTRVASIVAVFLFTAFWRVQGRL